MTGEVEVRVSLTIFICLMFIYSIDDLTGVSCFGDDGRKTKVLTDVGLSPCSHNNTLVTSVPGCTAPLFRDKI